MRRSASIGTVKQSKQGMIALCLVLIVLLSAALTLALFDHAHDQSGVGNSCTVCVQIQNAVDNLLKQLGLAFGHASLAVAACFAMLAALLFRSISNDLHTLVSLKIRLNH